MKTARFIAVGLLLIVSTMINAQAQTTITDTIRIAPGNSTFSGRVVVTAPEMRFNSTTYAPWSQTYTITAGALSLTLIPNDTSLPAGTSYRVQYYPSTGALSWSETWYVPASATALQVDDVKERTLATPNVPRLPLVQLGNVGTAGQTIVSDGTKWVPGSTLSDPTFSIGDLIYRATNGIQRLAIGTSGQFLRVSGGFPAWQSVTTDSITEGSTNLYLTSTRIREALSAVSPLAYNSTTGQFSCPTCGIGSVPSVFGRTGAVTAQSGDYLAFYSLLGHAHSGSDITSGTVAPSYLGSGAPSASNYLRGDGSWQSVTGGNTYTILSTSGTVTSGTSLTIPHNYNRKSVIVSCRNSSDQWVLPSTITTSLNSTAITFANSTTATCTVFGGAGLYGQAFTGQTSVALTHNFGTKDVLFSCTDDSNDMVIEPSSATATDLNTLTVTFTSAQTGRCVVGAGLAVGAGGGGSGSVTSVALSAPAQFSVSGSPVTDTGTLAFAWASQSANRVLAAPNGSSGAPTFRAIVPADLGTGTPNSTTYLRGDGTWATPAGGGGSGTVYTGAGLTGDGSSGDPVRIDASGGAASQVVYTGNPTSWGTIAAASCGEKNITATGVQAGDTIAAGWPILTTGLVGMMYPQANIIVVRICNVTGTGIAVADGLAFSGRVVKGF